MSDDKKQFELHLKQQDGTVRKFRQLVAVVEDRHLFTGEPLKLRIVGMDEQVDIRVENQFVILWGDAETFKEASGG